MNELNVNEHLRVCTKLHQENRITTRNVWQLHIIDILRKMATTPDPNIFRTVVPYLEIGAKVYGLRLEDIHTKVLQLAHLLHRSHQSNEEVDIEELKRKNIRKRNRKLRPNKDKVLNRDVNNLYGGAMNTRSCIFTTNDDINASNLLSWKLRTSPATHRVTLLSCDKYWSRSPDRIWDNGDELLNIAIPKIAHRSLCRPVEHFETGPDENGGLIEKELLDAPNLPLVELDEPIPIEADRTKGAEVPRRRKRRLVIPTKDHKAEEPIDFSRPREHPVSDKYVPGSAPPDQIQSPVPPFLIDDFHRLTDALLLKPEVPRAKIGGEFPVEEVQEFEPAEEEFIEPEVEAPPEVPCAKRAKKIDMNKLKRAIWESVSRNSETQFSTLYRALPRDNLSGPLAVMAVLHLCNERNLELRQDESYKDFTIVCRKPVIK